MAKKYKKNLLGERNWRNHGFCPRPCVAIRKSLYWPYWAFVAGPKFWPPMPRPLGQLFTGPMAEISTANTITSQSWKIFKEAILLIFCFWAFNYTTCLARDLVARSFGQYIFFFKKIQPAPKKKLVKLNMFQFHEIFFEYIFGRSWHGPGLKGTDCWCLLRFGK